MSASRNDPCPCGSGQKYKKCCLDAPDPRTERRQKVWTIGGAVLATATLLSFVLAGYEVGSAVALGSFGVAIGYMLIG